MGLGDRPLNVNRRYDKDTGSYWTSYILNTTPRQEPPYCPHRGNLGECEEWAPCAEDTSPAARAWGPGWPVQGDHVERRSNNAYLLNMVISENPDIGSPSGHYRVCVAPMESLIGTPSGTCREYDFTDR